MVRFVLVTTVCIVLLLGVGFGGVAVAETADVDTAQSSNATAERTVSTTAPAPGETIGVTMVVETPASAPIDYLDDFTPEFASGSYDSSTENGSTVFPLFQDVTGDSAVVTFDDVGPGTIEINYEVTVPGNASAGTVHEFDGTLQVNETEVPIEGPSSVVVGGAEPAQFDVSLTSVPETVTAGEEIPVEYAIENVGNSSDTQEVTFSVNGTQTATETVSLDAGEQFAGTFGYSTDDADVPAVGVEVASADDAATGTVSVSESESSPNFEIDIDESESDSEVTAGENLTAVAEVTNTGEDTGTQTIEFTINGSIVTTESVTLDPDETETVSFEGLTGPGDTPAVEVTVASADDADSTTVTVLESSASFEVSLTSVPDTVTAGEEISIAYAIENNGSGPGTQDVVFEVNGSQEGAQTVGLNADEQFDGTFSYATDGDDVPAVGLRVASDDEDKSQTTAVTEPSGPANFSVRIDDGATDEEVTAGEEATVVARVTNTGGSAGTQAVTFSVDGTAVASDQVSRDSGESDTVTFSYATGGADVPGLDIAIASDNDTATRTVTVLEPSASFGVSLRSVPETVTAGEDTSVAYAVENEGNEEGTQEVSFSVGGTQVDAETVSLDAGERFEGTFSYATDDADVPEIPVEVASADDAATATVAVSGSTSGNGDGFAVAIDGSASDSEVAMGETATIVANVTHTGSGQATGTVQFTVDGTAVANRSVTLDGGEATTVTFSYEETEGSDFTAEVASSTAADSRTVAVREPAWFGVTIQAIDDEVAAGEDISVDVEIENTGGVTATRDVTLTVGGVQVDSRAPTLGAGETTDLSFTYTTDEADAPEVSVGVVGDGTASQSVSVVDDGGTEVETDDSVLPGFGISVAVLAVLVVSAGLLFVRRRGG